MSRKYAGRNIRDLDVDDFNFGRPKKRSRPRTKVRPDYSDAEIGRVITIDRGRYQCVMESTGNLVIATKARQLGRKGSNRWRQGSGCWRYFWESWYARPNRRDRAKTNSITQDSR